MRRMREIVVFTPDLEALRSFYEGALGLEPSHASPHWTAYRTSGATLALHPLSDHQERGLEVTLESPDAMLDAETLRARGVRSIADPSRESYGTILRLRDPEGNGIALLQSNEAPPQGGPRLGNVLLNVRDLEGVAGFYREALGLVTAVEAPHWIEFDTGGTRLAIHARTGGFHHPLHAAQRVACCFEIENLPEWADALRARGGTLATAPTDEDFGLYAEAIDPDGNVVVFREPRRATREEELDGAFADEDESTHPVGIRRPVRKGSKAVSRVALKPEYKPRRAAARTGRPLSGTTQKVVSVRGAGPEGTRALPKRTADEKKARVKPASGLKKKSEMRTATLQRTARASASKSKPVKRAAARRTRGGR